MDKVVHQVDLIAHSPLVDLRCMYIPRRLDILGYNLLVVKLLGKNYLASGLLASNLPACHLLVSTLSGSIPLPVIDTPLMLRLCAFRMVIGYLLTHLSLSIRKWEGILGFSASIKDRKQMGNVLSWRLWMLWS